MLLITQYLGFKRHKISRITIAACLLRAGIGRQVRLELGKVLNFKNSFLIYSYLDAPPLPQSSCYYPKHHFLQGWHCILFASSAIPSASSGT